MARVTPNPAALTGSERAVTLAAAAVFHLGLLALLLSVSSASGTPEVRPGVMSLISIAPLPARSEPPPPALPSKVNHANRVATKMAIPADREITHAGATAGCPTLDVISEAIVADPPAVAAVLAAPPEIRSIAEAVVLWNDGWINAGAPDARLGPTRLAVEHSLASLSPECLDEPIAGPRLVPIPAGSGTMFVVFGSGTWTWRQLLDEPKATAASEETGLNSVLSTLWNSF